MTGETWTWVLGTVALWTLSAAIAVALGVLFAAGTTSRIARPAALAAIHLTRGVPTSLFVVGIGMASLRVSDPPALPALFPGTSPEFQLCAWALVFALALGSSGHLAVIFLTAWESVGVRLIEQAKVLGLSTPAQIAVVGREVLPVAIGATGPRLVHHLHNTSFVALFPVADVFGGVVERANETFEVVPAVAVGAALYIGMSTAIWAVTRLFEIRLRAPRAPRAVAAGRIEAPA